MFSSFEFVGFLAGTLVAVSLLPQVIKVFKTKSTRDISLMWSLINEMGQILWIVYGVFIGSQSLVIMSGITLSMNTILIFLKIVFDKKSVSV